MALLRWLRGVMLLVGISLLVLVVNTVQMMSVVLLLFDRRTFMRCNMIIKAFYCGAVANAALLCGNRLEVTGDAARRENSIVMANHQSYIDIPALWIWGGSFGTVGWMKWFVKDEFKYFPGVGWGLKFVNAIFVKRDWSRDADSIRETFKKIMDGDVPFWVMIFPEGTRMKAAKYKASQTFSQKRGTLVFQRVLFPRPKGVWSTIQGLRSKLSAIYDVDIAFTSAPPTVIQFFCKGNFTIKLHVTRIDVSVLPMTERDFNQWMQDRFAKKDQWMLEHSGWDVAKELKA